MSLPTLQRLFTDSSLQDSSSSDWIENQTEFFLFLNSATDFPLNVGLNFD